MARKQGGFTIVETMIAVTVFSVLAMLTTLAVIQLSRSYQFGSSKTKLLDASRQIHARFTQAVQYGADTSTSVGTITSTTGTTYNVWCAGSTRFSWVLSSGSTIKTYTTNNPNKGALYADAVSGPGNCTSDTLNTDTAEKLLPQGSFVTIFSPSLANGYAQLNTRFNLGEADMYRGNDVGNGCESSSLAGVEFCAVVQYDSTATEKVVN